MRNEKGYALVLVLLIITVTFIFALSLSGMALSARKQVNKIDHLNTATDLAEMGIAHYEAMINRIVQETNSIAASAVGKNKHLNYDEIFYSIFQNEVISQEPLPTKTIESKHSYEVFSPVVSQQDDRIAVSFKSKGKSKEEEKILDTVILVQRKGAARIGQQAPDKNTFKYLFESFYEVKTGKGAEVLDDSSYFKAGLELQGHTSLTIHGIAFFNSDVVLKGNDLLIIYGDAIFAKKVEDADLKGSKSAICVYGDTYLVDSNNQLSEYVPFNGGDTSVCPRPLYQEWYIDPTNGIEVTY